ncbi:MAG: DUF721 domain-containing protein [Gammaproteobacteria bacterium]|nr:DUF721 domain-containing protein [Gammaproteobacteria bacterium]
MDKSSNETVASIVAALCQQTARSRQQQAGADDAAMLGQLLSQQAACQQLQTQLQRSVEFWPARTASVSHVQQHELVIRCSDGSTASRLRFIQNDVLLAVQNFASTSSDASVRDTLGAVTRIRVMVVA